MMFDNPLFTWLTHQENNVSIRAPLRMFVGAFGAGLIIVFLEGGTFQYIVSGPFDIIFIFAVWIFTTLAPIIVAVFVAELTARHAGSDLPYHQL